MPFFNPQAVLLPSLANYDLQLLSLLALLGSTATLPPKATH
jgi:hypothetical protein